MEGYAQMLRLKNQIEQKKCEADYLGIQISNYIKGQINNDEQKHLTLIEILKLRKREEQVLTEINDCLDLEDKQNESVMKNQNNDLTIQSYKSQVMELNLQLQRIKDLMQSTEDSNKQCEFFMIETQEYYLNQKSHLANLQDQLGKIDIQLMFDLVEEQQNSQNLQNLKRKEQDLLSKITELEKHQIKLQRQLQKKNKSEQIYLKEQEQIQKDLNQKNQVLLSISDKLIIEEIKYSDLQQQSLKLMRNLNHEQIRTFYEQINKSNKTQNQDCQELIFFDLEKIQINQNRHKNNQQESQSMCGSMTDIFFSKHEQSLEILPQQQQNDLEANLEKQIQLKKESQLNLSYLRDQQKKLITDIQKLSLQLQEKVQKQKQKNIQIQEKQKKLLLVSLETQQSMEKLTKVKLEINSTYETDNKEGNQKFKIYTKLKMENQVQIVFQQRLLINQQIINLLQYQQEMLLLKVDHQSIARQKCKLTEKIKQMKDKLKILNSYWNSQIATNNHRLNQLYQELQNNQQFIEDSLKKNHLLNQVRQDINIKIQDRKLRQVALIEEIKSVYYMINEHDKMELQQIIESQCYEQLNI